MKIKTKSSIRKRFKVTASGKVKAFNIGNRDRMLHKRDRTLRRKDGGLILSDVRNKKIRKMLGGF
jgi:large subunit ribosomal protein L35